MTGEGGQCPIADCELQLLATASRHRFFSSIRREEQNDGYIIDEELNQALDSLNAPIPSRCDQCDCVAHERIKLTSSEIERDDLKSLIRSDSMKTSDTGCNYAVALLRQLFTRMGMTQFHAERSGSEFGVSYILRCGNEKYPFRGYPDIIVHKEDIGAGRILAATGEIQSTNLPYVQNSIYGIGSLVRNGGRRPIICITIYNNKSAQLSMARLTSQPDPEREGALGTVSLRFVGNPAALDLTTLEGLKTFSTRLHYTLKDQP